MSLKKYTEHLAHTTLLNYAFLGNEPARVRNLLVVPSTMNRDGHPMGLGWLSLILFGLSVAPGNIISVGYGATRVAEPDVLHGPAAIAIALVVFAYGAFLTRHFYLAEFLAVPAFVIAFVWALPLIWGLHVGMILWVVSILCLVIAAYRCDGYRERGLAPGAGLPPPPQSRP